MQRRRIGQNGPLIATLGFGAAPIGGFGTLMTESAATQTVAAAIQAGVDIFDVGPLSGMGLAEHRLGTALRQTQSAPLVAMRVGNLLQPDAAHPQVPPGFCESLPFRPCPDYSRGGLLRGFEDSQQRLALPRPDILIIDDPAGSDLEFCIGQLLDSGFAALTELRDAGLISAIASAIESPRLAEQIIAATDLDLVVIPGRFTLLDQSASTILDHCRSRGLSAMVSSPFNSGILASPPVKGARYFGAEATPDTIERARRITAICAAHATPLPAAALQFPLTRDEVVCVIAGMTSPEEVAQNAALLRHPVPVGLWDDLRTEALLDLNPA